MFNGYQRVYSILKINPYTNSYYVDIVLLVTDKEHYEYRGSIACL